MPRASWTRSKIREKQAKVFTHYTYKERPKMEDEIHVPARMPKMNPNAEDAEERDVRSRLRVVQSNRARKSNAKGKISLPSLSIMKED